VPLKIIFSLNLFSLNILLGEGGYLIYSKTAKKFISLT